jgi:polysaccharide export outer membrane protein
MEISMRKLNKLIFILLSFFWLTACTSSPELNQASQIEPGGATYLIGAGDNVNVFVWGNTELSSTVPVRPDGKITTPLIEDVQASGKTPTQLARDMEQRLKRYIKNPIVTVIVTDFLGRYSEQVRVVGEATEPKALPYREHMTLLDVMIEVGGLTEFASGNSAKLVRIIDGKQIQYDLNIDDLIRDGDIQANVKMLPGDIVIIPESWF